MYRGSLVICLLRSESQIALDCTAYVHMVWGGEAPPQGPGVEPLSGGFSAARCGTIKCNFFAAPPARNERFLCLFQMK